MTTHADIAKIIEFIQAELPRADWKPWPGGWPHQSEAALIDAVLSISAKYGTEDNGVRGAVQRYRRAVGDGSPDNLSRLASFDETELQTVLNHQVISGRSKASAIVEAACNLRDAGVRSAADLDPHNSTQKSAYTSVHGLGPVTWEYLGMLLGKPGIKADRWIIRFVKRGLDREMTSTEARALLREAARELGASPIELDHAVWAHERESKARG